MSEPNTLNDLRPDQALNLAKKHIKQGNYDKAKCVYNAILTKFPKNKFAQQALLSLNKPKPIEANQTPPPDTMNGLVNLYNHGQLASTIDMAQKLTEKYPNAFIVWNILGAAAAQKGQLEKANIAFQRVISIQPDYTDAYNNLGNVLRDQGQLEEAIEVYNKALSLKPDHAEANYNIGLALKGQGKLDEAIAAYSKAISLKPDYADAYNNLGNALQEQEKFNEAIEAYSKALSCKPDYAYAHSQKLLQQAKICDWSSVKDDLPFLAELGISGDVVTPFSLLAIEDAPEMHHLRSKNFATKKLPQKPLTSFVSPTNRPKRLRIGYFSADFREHPVAYVIAKVIEAHNRDEFEVFGYSLHGKHQDKLRQRLENAFDRFIDVKGLSDREVALQARQDNIDIAIDLMGYTKNSRTGIFAYRAAPIQINYLGYPGTMGADFMDYIVADRHIIPPENQKYFNEKVLYLPNTYMPTDNGRELSERPMKRSDMGLPEDAFVFCCFNNNYKITSSEFDIWMRLLNKVEGSVLWLRSSNQWAELNIKKEAQKRKVDPERIVFAGKVPMDEHLARHRLADLFIDTFIYNAHSTATEALWAGLPIVTKTGQGFAARVAGSLLNAVGLPELVTESEEAYEALALELATNPEHLADIKVKLEANRLTQPLFNTKQYTNHLENGYQQVYQNYLDGKPPQTTNVQK